MKYQSAIVSAASGSVGGCTFSRNRYGKYIRNRSIPVNPSSSFQQVVRNLLAVYTARWGTLSQALRDAWDTYALLTPVTDALGQPITLSGINMYVRTLVFRAQITGVALSDTAPASPGLATLTPPSIVADVSSGIIVTFTTTDIWAIAAGGALAVYQSRAYGIGRAFFKGPYRLAGRILGAGTPPTSPATLTPTPFPYAILQRVFFQVRVTDNTQKLSSPLRFTTTAVA